MRLRGISIRMYDVGWGDCFLLRFSYAGGVERHVLIDFGTTAASLAEERERLMPIALDIRERCGGKLDAVVATHRHRDHIGGFAELKRSTAPGNVIARLEPEIVLQPWTENRRSPRGPSKGLLGMERFIGSVPKFLERMSGDFSLGERNHLLAMAQQNYANRQAVESLARLGRKRVYARAGSRTGMEALLPGFTVRVLGPARPGVSKWSEMLADPMGETWRLLLRGDNRERPDHPRRPLFPDAPHWHPAMAPPRMRWFISQVNRLRAEELMRLARAAHTEINNTSLVLLIEGYGHRLLFPGDTELHGWASILHSADTRDALRDVTLYKASHHGAGNGTPRSVWALIGQRAANLRTLVSRGRAMFSDGQRLLGELGLGSNVTDTAELRAAGLSHTDVDLEPQAPPVKLVA